MQHTINTISKLVQTGTVSDIKDGMDALGIEHINTNDYEGYTLLQRAAIHGKAAIATYLVAHGAKINPENLHPDAKVLADTNRHEDLANYLAMAKQAQDFPIESKRGARFGRTP